MSVYSVNSLSTKLVDTKIPQLRGRGIEPLVVRQWLNFPQVAEEHGDYPAALVFFALLPVNLATDARMNLNDAAVPVVARVLWLIASHFVSDSECFERVRTWDASE